MANISVVVQSIGRAALAPTYLTPLSVSDVYQVPNTGRVILHFKKTGAGACTVTVRTPGSVLGLAIAEHTFVVPATTGDVMVSDFEFQTFNATNQNYLEFTVSEITGLSVAALQSAG